MSGRVGPDATARVSDPDEAQSVFARGFFGTVNAGGLELDPFEVVYLSEMRRLEVVDGRGHPLEWSRLFRRACRARREFGVRYVVYRDLRQRGYVVRSSPPPVAFAVLPRGGVLHKTPARFWVEPFSERTAFDLARLFDLADRAQGAKKTLLLAVVDEESDLTYYRVRRPSPTGALEPRGGGGAVPAWLSEDRVVVFDGPSVDRLGSDQGYGSRIGNRLELSLIEAAYLADAGQLDLRDARTHRSISSGALARRALRLDSRFRERLAAYRELRRRRLVVKTGFKYGAHFRAYPRRPEVAHARYLVQAVPATHRTGWPEVAGGVRVAQGVRKDWLVAGVRPDASVRFLSLERVRP